MKTKKDFQKIFLSFSKMQQDIKRIMNKLLLVSHLVGHLTNERRPRLLKDHESYTLLLTKTIRKKYHTEESYKLYLSIIDFRTKGL